MQNKANLPDAQMNENLFATKDYENEAAFRLRQNKANQTQPVVSLSNLFQRQKNAAEFVERIFARENSRKGALT
jgi:hypothetical protein